MTISRTSDRGHFSTSPTLPVGSLMPYAASTTILNAVVPPGWLLCSGGAVNRTTYGSLFGCIVPFMGNPTISSPGDPGVVTLNNHGLVAGNTVYFTTTGALPTGISANTLYYVISGGLTANTFWISASSNGAAINTSGSQSGTHSLYFCPYGLGDGSTTFNTPNLRGNVPAGLDNMGGTAANRINTGVNSGQTIGALGGEQTHTLTTAEMPAHTHPVSYALGDGTASVDGTAITGNSHVLGGAPEVYNATYATATGGGGSHNNLQPYMLVNWIIKAT